MSNRVMMIAAGVMVLAALGIAVWGTSEPAVAPPGPIPTESPEPAHPWRDAALTEADGLRFAVLEPGAGRSPVEGDVITLDVKGWVESTERSFLEVADLKGVLGRAEMVEGVKRSLLSMKAGEVRLVHVPAAMGFGQTGKPPLVPHDADLVYEIALKAVEDAPAVPEKPADAEPDQESGGVRYAVLREGSGEPAKAGDTVALHFTTWLADGTFVDSTLQRLDPVEVELGASQLYPGMEAGVTGMKAGEQRKLVIPPALAFGDAGRGPIPGGATLVVEASLVSIR